MGREELLRPRIAQLDAPHEGCTGAGLGSDPLARAFLQGGDLSMSCAVPLGATRLLPDGLDALNAKVEALTGSAVSRSALLAGDPMMPLDWSNAPDLDLIYLNYLNMNADFSGYLVARMLAWHAARGTIVRILVSDVMLTDTDRNLFEGLAAQYPTVQIQPYRFPASAAEGLEGQLGRLHRVTHVKLFATISRQAGRSRVMIGGRNIHEGYFFEEPRDLSAYAFLHHYDPSQTRLTGGFSTYEDFEIELRSDPATHAIARHMAALWHRDFDTQSLRPAVEPHAGSARTEGMVRHFISVPFADGRTQISYYAQLIDAAQHSIEIAIPYLNLPPALDAALHRARLRGVRVDVVTTVRVREATDFMVSNLNRTFANDFGDWVSFIDYDPEPRLLHAKLIVIDDRLTIIASTNLNMRSFVHDMENGLLIMDRAIARQVSAIIQGYIGAGDRMYPGQEIPGYIRFLQRLALIMRAF
ncbi:phosphatidylserine/phosphatidylglycerophosphate/cardiolipin synthase family protein [Pararhodobacter sp.]|uniref:phospholipase D-like domain-containing protein n=1 Tax=Pararhodobacter sp. TaxID=2127056 RepID=UPI002AFEB5B2|nr:phosphatidylserine/phosphatidylglycerophosphate/cardiolipin synthase family protein [Pararhodobacter sp.]